MNTPETRYGRRSVLATMAGFTGLYLASRLLSENVASSASPTAVVPKALGIVSEGPDFLSGKDIIVPSAGRSIASLREAQSARTCRFLNVFGGGATQSAKDSQIDITFFGFSDQQGGIDTYNGSSQYYDMLGQYLTLVQTWAKREVDMNLSFSIARNAVMMDKPLLGTNGYKSQMPLYNAILGKLALPEPTKRTNKLLIALVNPDTELYQVMYKGTDGNPYPGFSTCYFPRYTASLISSIPFIEGYRNFGPTVIDHESVYHGLIGNPNHNNDPDNPNPNPNSIAKSSISVGANLSSLVLDDWDIRNNVCVNNRTSLPYTLTKAPAG